MEALGSISTRGSLLSFADVTGEIKRPLMYASSCPARCLLSRRLYLHSGLSSLVLPCTHLRCFELPPCWHVGHTFLCFLPISCFLYRLKPPIYGSWRSKTRGIGYGSFSVSFAGAKQRGRTFGRRRRPLMILRLGGRSGGELMLVDSPRILLTSGFPPEELMLLTKRLPLVRREL